MTHSPNDLSSPRWISMTKYTKEITVPGKGIVDMFYMNGSLRSSLKVAKLMSLFHKISHQMPEIALIQLKSSLIDQNAVESANHNWQPSLCTLSSQKLHLTLS